MKKIMPLALFIFISSCSSDKVVPFPNTAILIIKDSLKEGVYYAKDSSLISGLVTPRDTIHTFTIPLTIAEVRKMYEYPWHAFFIDSVKKIKYGYIPDSGNVYPKQHAGAIYEKLSEDDDINDDDD